MDIRIEEACYTYENTRFTLGPLSHTFKARSATAIVGANGSGKTTLAKLIMGMIKPDSGRIWYGEKEGQTLSLAEKGTMIGYLFQNPKKQLFATTVLEEVTFPLVLKGVAPEVAEDRAMEVLKTLKLEYARHYKILTLSKGETQGVALACLLVNQPKFLLLDEPTTGLDEDRIENLSRILDELKAQGMGLILISHHQGFLNRHGETKLVLEQGKVVSYV